MSKPDSPSCIAASATGSRPAETGHDSIAACLQAQRLLVRARRVQTAMFGGLFLLAVAGSVWLSEVSLNRLLEGFPGLVAYVAGTLPVIHLDSMRADLAEWYWGLGRWLLLLLDTVVIAFMGTLLGATSAVVLSF